MFIFATESATKFIYVLATDLVSVARYNYLFLPLNQPPNTFFLVTEFLLVASIIVCFTTIINNNNNSFLF